MYPNQSPSLPPVPPGYDSDQAYLDSIAAPMPVKTVKPWLLWGIIGGVILLVIVVVMAASSGGPSSTARFEQYVYRLQALEKVSTTSRRPIQDSKLRAINASMGAILGTADQQSTTMLPYLKLKKLPPAPKTSPITAEYVTLNATLEDSRLNGDFDRVYSREVGYQLAKLRAEINVIYKSTRSKTLKAYLLSTDKNIEPIIKQYNEFNSSES